jgi:hypothetical protein
LPCQLYFAAYQHRIFVYIPRHQEDGVLTPSPALVLFPKPTHAAAIIGGHANKKQYHQANHITTGFLGDLEIVATNYDDGDVVAYSVQRIAEYLSPPDGKARPRPRPLFQANVGSTAWGLAIHKNSRLLAVSSNRAEVTVFAFGLSQPVDPPCGKRRMAMSACEQTVRQRKRDWRIILPLGKSGTNIPSIAFIDNPRGFADKVYAIDILGAGWILDIWAEKTAPIKHPSMVNPHNDRRPG